MSRKKFNPLKDKPTNQFQEAKIISLYRHYGQCYYGYIPSISKPFWAMQQELRKIGKEIAIDL